jgi:acetyltransferase-like isoleucine patch superfamily enzyme
MAVPGWVIYACRTSFAVEVAEVIWRRGEDVAVLVDNLEDGGGMEAAAPDPAAEIGAPVSRPTELSAAQREMSAVVPLITPGHRFAVEAEARALGLASFPALVDPTAVVGAATKVGRFAHVNRSASLGHHNVIEDYATLGPGCLLAGHVRVGRGSFVGAGAVCAPEVVIGPDAIVGAGATVVSDVPAEAVVVGNPATVIREGGGGYGGVTVPPAAR